MVIELWLERRHKNGRDGSPISPQHWARLVKTSTLYAISLSFFSDFPLSVFIDLLYCLVQIRIERLDPSSHPILISDLDSALGSLKEGIQPHHLRLLQIYNLSARRSPKRRTYSVASSGQSSPEAKRPRLLSPVASSTHGEDLTPKLSGNGLPSPTPSAGSLAPSDAPTVTVSMLRALTKDLRKKYITS